MPPNYHVFRDPVHGYIQLNDLERDLVDTRPFQRLRHIHQLAFTNLVYHGAEHTRFGHSLGVMEIATRIYNVLLTKHRETLGWDDDRVDRNRQLLRLAALLHDLGHAPFSHAAEGLFPDGMTHEDMSAKIITETEIAQVIEDKAGFDIHAQDVADVIAGEGLGDAAFLREIMAGELDADRIDYLNRDSLMAGVQYGRFDYERLIQTLTIYKDDAGSPFIAVEEGGVHAVEGLILARYFMFTQVYFHRARRVYDMLLGDVLPALLSGGRYPDAPSEFIKWDDLRTLNAIRDLAESPQGAGRDEARRIWYRQHFRLIDRTAESADPSELRRWHQMLQVAKQQFGETAIIEDSSEKAPHRFGERDLRVLTREGEDLPITAASSIVGSIPKIDQRRAYATNDEQRDEIYQFMDEYKNTHRIGRR